MHEMSGLNQYKNVNVESKLNSATPHGLVAMLLEGLLQKLAVATGATQRGEPQTKGTYITGAIRIIDSLRASLDLDKGGDLASNLYSLYDYMERRLVEANLKSDVKILNEVNSLVGEIKAGWDAIPEEQRS